MKSRLNYRPFDFRSTEDLACRARWENDPTIRESFQVFPDEAALQRTTTVEDLLLMFATTKHSMQKQTLMILLDRDPVGEISFVIDQPPIMTALANTAWAGIVIGEKSARGQGIGLLAMQELESRARQAGAERMELGVFEFNEPALGLYKKLGYREFSRIPNFTFSKGRMWADIRMIKELRAR